MYTLTMNRIQRKHIFIGWGIIALLILLGGYFTFIKQSPASSVGMNSHTNLDTNSISFNGKMYTKVLTIPKQDAPEYTSESYQWATDGETIKNWKTLLTTHKLSPRDQTRSLSSVAYAPNVALMNEKKGATIIEKSVINSPDAIAAGIDANNPPYIIVYAFPVGDASRTTELAIQKIQNSKNGTLEIFISAQRIIFKTPDEVNTYLKSPSYLKIRAEVINAHMPY